MKLDAAGELLATSAGNSASAASTPRNFLKYAVRSARSRRGSNFSSARNRSMAAES